MQIVRIKEQMQATKWQRDLWCRLDCPATTVSQRPLVIFSGCGMRSAAGRGGTRRVGVRLSGGPGGGGEGGAGVVLGAARRREPAGL